MFSGIYVFINKYVIIKNQYLCGWTDTNSEIHGQQLQSNNKHKMLILTTLPKIIVKWMGMYLAMELTSNQVAGIVGSDSHCAFSYQTISVNNKTKTVWFVKY